MSNCVDTKELARQLGIIRTKNLAKTMKKDGISKVFQPFDYLVVLDFESTCWKDNKNRPSEIIEFPVVWLDTHTGQILSEFREYVMPMQHPQLSAFCTSLTGITQHQVDSGIPLNIAIKRLQNWASNLCTHHDAIFIHSIASSFKMNHRGVKSLSGNSSLRVDNNNNHANNNVNSNTPRNKSNSNNSHNISCSGWSDVCERKAINTACVVTWSDWDIGVCLAGECHRKCITVPACLNTWVDLRATYKNFYGCKPDGLKGALDRVGLAFEGREHSGLMDSRNTAMLCVRMMKDGCVLQATKSLIPALNLVKLNKFLITWVRERGAVSNDNINNNDNNNNKDNNSNNPNNNHNNKNNDNNNSRDNCKLKDKKRNNKNIINHNRSNKVYAKTCLIDDANGFLDGCRNIKNNNNNNNINNKFNNNDSRNNNADINGSIKSIDTNNTNINNDNFDNSNNNHTSSRSNVNNDFKINKNICKKEIFNVIAVNGREDPDLKINNNNNESKFDYKNKSNNTIINNRQTNTSINNNYNTTNKNNNIDESDWIKEDDDDIFNTSLALKFCDDDDVDSFNHFSGGNITSKLEEINDNNTKIFEEKNVEKLKISITINSNEITNNINEIPNNSNKYNIDNNYPKDKSTITRSYNDITNITNKNNKYSNVNNNDNNKCISTTIINDNNTGFSDEEDNDLLAASLLEDEDCHSSSTCYITNNNSTNVINNGTATTQNNYIFSHKEAKKHKNINTYFKSTKNYNNATQAGYKKYNKINNNHYRKSNYSNYNRSNSNGGYMVNGSTTKEAFVLVRPTCMPTTPVRSPLKPIHNQVAYTVNNYNTSYSHPNYTPHNHANYTPHNQANYTLHNKANSTSQLQASLTPLNQLHNTSVLQSPFSTPKHSIRDENSFEVSSFSKASSLIQSGTLSDVTFGGSSMKRTPPLCNCGSRSRRKVVSNGGKNNGKCFFVCPRTTCSNTSSISSFKKVKKSCNFFKWEEDGCENIFSESMLVAPLEF